MTALHDTYRPNAWDQVYGQQAIVNALRSAVENKSSQAFLLSGPSGVGKTTLARIAAFELGCDEQGVTEIDGATYNGIDQMREIQGMIQYKPFGQSPTRAVIIDECHGLSGQAWKSLLKAIEEPPPDVYWFFCTTEPGKLDKTVHTRCIHLQLKEIGKDELTDLVEAVAGEEKIKLPPEIRQIIVSKADGSARQALVNLAACREISSRTEAAELLQDISDAEEAVELLRLLSKGSATWSDAMRVLHKINGAKPEEVRIQAANWFAKCAKGAKSEREARFFLQMLENFSTAYHNATGQAQLLRSIGLCVFPD